MNDFLFTELAREHNARLAQEARTARLIRAAERVPHPTRAHRKRHLLRPRHAHDS